jgi:histidinol-phosphate aminotransferase
MTLLPDSSTPAQHTFPIEKVNRIVFPALKPVPDDYDTPSPHITRLSLNEAPYPPSPRALAAARKALAWSNRYPDHYCMDLVREISDRTGVPTDAIIFGSGSGELLVQSALVALEPGDEAVMPSPTFPTCGKGVQIAGATIVNVPVRDDGVNDIPAMLKAITPRSRLFYICTPNNPTGGIVSVEDLRLAIAEVPHSCLLVIDEAYHEFAGHEGGPEILPLLAGRQGPWVVSRTFSKAYCMAGLRVGYALASSAALALGFARLRNNFNVNRVALAAALAALKDDAYVTDIIEKTVAERRYLGAELARLINASSLPSFANFVTIRLPVPALPVVEALAREGIEVQFIKWPDALGAIRISVGTRADSDRLLTALREILKAV